ncbi:DUF982 domain-containing protein [Pseudaminobacter sp. 19-2017]|uniref:DUF982 domain-containing protein n=1 Tax=Pseudaminobacter soli (ex Zhang et al. 2022) TaxID=2831468 RepID=A0A942E2R3_9HYPH|nr:DUF982 domain-containing protein [Pseudaminobacter soli]MBS3650078.1 DUF982 domain-containing protein [Pseudaminobacter soli]
MNDRRFPTPVEIVEGQARRAVGSAWEALEWLEQHKAIGASRNYRAAVRTCLDTLDGWAPPAKARRRFLAAVRELSQLVGERGRAERRVNLGAPGQAKNSRLSASALLGGPLPYGERRSRRPAPSSSPQRGEGGRKAAG